MHNDIVALIPAYNPDKGMIQLVQDLKKEFSQIVVVDDGCSEEYSEVFAAIDNDVTLLHHEVNMGKGRALKTGFSYVLEHFHDAKGVVTLDADGQHTVADTVNCCDKFLEDPKTVVFGCRDFLSDTKIPPRSRFGNRLTSRLLKFCNDISLSDTQTGLRVVSYACLKDLCEIKGDRYEYEMNMIFRLKELGILFVEVPIEVIYIEDNASSHFNPIVDSFKIYKVFFKFILSSLASFAVDIILFSILVALIPEEAPDGGALPYLLMIEYQTVISTWVARIFSGSVNYCINKRVFKKEHQSKGSARRYLTVWFVQMMLSAFLVYTFVKLLHGNATITKMLVDVVLFICSFKVQQLWVFKADKKENG